MINDDKSAPSLHADHVAKPWTGPGFAVSRNLWHIRQPPPVVLASWLPSCYGILFLPEERIWKRDAAERRGKCESAIHHGLRTNEEVAFFAFLTAETGQPGVPEGRREH